MLFVLAGRGVLVGRGRSVEQQKPSEVRPADQAVPVGTDDTGGLKSKLSIALASKIKAEKNVLVKSDGQLNVDGELKAARVDVYGELAVKGSILSDVYLGDGAILSGTGEILGTVFANDGSLLSIGNSPGMLDPGAFDFTGGTVNLRFEVGAAAGDDSLAGINWDFLNVDGTLTIADSTNVVIQIISGDFDNPFAVADWNPSQNYRWLFMQANDLLGFDTSKFTFDLAALNGFDLLNPADGGRFSVLQESNRLYIEFTPTTNSSVPEPGSFAIIGISGFAFFLGRYRPFRRP